MAEAGGEMTPDRNDTILSSVKKVTSYLDEQQRLDGQQLVFLRNAMSRLEKLASEPKDCTGKIFNDPIHGHMEFPTLCVKIIDTPEFQRLRYIKQLGGGYFVYPDASHNRFEHSLGVCHLAGLLVTELRDRQPELEITPEDVLCVQIAGLCHDLGHGPFSHVFDNKFIPAVKPELKGKWKHEDASLVMFDHMVEQNKLEDEFKRCGLEEDHRKFIKELITGKEPSSNEFQQTWLRGSEKAFLYEIVANKRNGVDVDKWDYFQRDCHHLGMTSSFDLKRFIKFARVITVTKKEETPDAKKEETLDTKKEETPDTKKEETPDTKKEETPNTKKEETPDTKKEEISDSKKGESQICYRDKEAFNMYQLFHTRFTLHRRAYQHKTVQAVELMLVDAMKEADKFLKIPKGDGPGLTISECIKNMDAYTKLTDNVFHQILLSQDEEQGSPKRLAQTSAKKILNDLQQRKLYRCVGEIVIPVLAKEFMPNKEQSPEKEIEEIKVIMMEKTGKSKMELDQMIRMQASTLDYGKKAENPVNNVRFFKKDDEDTAVEFKAVEVSFLVPQLCFMEHLVRVYLIKGPGDESQNDDFIKQLQDACSVWCDEQKKQRYEDLGYKFKDGEWKKLPGSEVPAGSAVKDHATKFGERAFLKFCPTFHERSEKKKEVIVSEPAAP